MTALSAYSISTEHLPSAAAVPVHCAGACCLQVKTLMVESSVADGANVTATSANVTVPVTSRLPTLETVTSAACLLRTVITGNRAVIRALVLCAGTLRPLSGRVWSLQGMRLGHGQEHDRGLPAGCLHGASFALCALRVKHSFRVLRVVRGFRALHVFRGMCAFLAQCVFRGFHTLRAMRAKRAFRGFRALHGLRAKHGRYAFHPALSRRFALSVLPLLPYLSYLPVMPASAFKLGRPAIKRF